MPNTPFRYLRRDVDLTSALSDSEVIPAANPVQSVWVAALPAGITASLTFGNKQPFPISDGLNIEFGDCQEENQGIKITTTPAAPGQVCTLIFGVGGGIGVNS
jgi:hypothetical protein